MEPRELFLAHLALIDRLIAAICRRSGCSADEAEDFASWVKLRLIENDYGVLRKFAGRAKLSTYLSVVLGRYFLDYRIEKWGKWRPSAAARRRGEVAIRLDTLLHRDGRSFEDAVEILRRNEGVEASPEELASLAAELPHHPPRRFEGEAALAELVTRDGVGSRLEETERSATAQRVREALSRALTGLPPEDQLVLRLHFEEGVPLSRVARLQGLRQRPLYTRVEKACTFVRREMEGAGVGRDEVRAVLGWDPGGPGSDAAESAAFGPSKQRGSRT